MSNGTGNRQTQNKHEREKAKGREVTEAKREIKQLKRMVTRLQKTIAKMEQQRGVVIELLEESPEPTLGKKQIEVAIETEDPNRCLNCGNTTFTSFTTPMGKVLKGCRNCKERKS